jgi:hypothetical protein
VLFALPMFQVSALVNVTNEPAVPQTETSQDVLIINDAHKLAYFGWYMASEMPSTGWDLLNRTLVWATSYILQNETKIVFFTLDGTVTPEPGNEDAAAVYDWLGSAGYMIENIELHPIGDAGTLPSTHYDGFDLVLYWNVEGVNSTNIVASGVPFITVSAPQSADMGIGTGMYTTYEEKDVFHVVNNIYYPTQRYSLGPLLFESAMVVDATEATTHGRVLVKAEVESVGPQVEMSLMQDVEVSDVGSANMTFTLNIPEGPLANMYVESFFTEPPIDPEVEVPVPENKTEPEIVELEEGVNDVSLVGDINGDGIVSIEDIVIVALVFGTKPEDPKWNPNADIRPDHIIDIVDLVTIGVNFGAKRQPPPEMTVPVREVFHQGIFMEQDVLLGFGTVIVDSKILPRGANNETQISVNSYSPQLAKLNASIWRINVGPQDEMAANVSAEFMVTKIQYIQQMLRMLPGDQVYLYEWVMRIRLPSAADFLNVGELNGLDWSVDFGGGSYMECNLTALPTEVIVNETMVVTEHNMTASEDYLWMAFCQYKVFQIDYRLPELLSSQTASVEEPCTLGTEDWSKTFTLTFSARVPTKTWKLGPLTTKVEVNPTLTIQWYIGWKIRWFRLQWFETWVSVSPSVKVYAYAGVTASYSKTWHITLATLSRRFRFSIGWFPVWANIKLTIGAGISVEAYGTVSVSVAATAYAWFKAGVKWVRGSGWSGIWDHGWGASLSGPHITAEAGITVTPYASARLALLLYDVAGPFAEARPYAPISVTFNPRTWSINLKFKIIAGVTMSGWLKKLLGLGDWSRTLWDGTLKSWSGTW